MLQVWCALSTQDLAILPSLELKAQGKQLLGCLLLDIALRGSTLKHLKSLVSESASNNIDSAYTGPIDISSCIELSIRILGLIL